MEKPRLARKTACAALDLHPDGVFLVELAGAGDPGDIAAAVEVTIAGSAPAGRPSPTSIAALIGARRMLLVLDNCEHVIGVRRELADLLLRHCPKLRVLATSQEVLGLPGESVFPVPSLGLPELEEEADPQEVGRYESVRLFVDRARLGRSGFDLTASNCLSVARICRGWTASRSRSSLRRHG